MSTTQMIPTFALMLGLAVPAAAQTPMAGFGEPQDQAGKLARYYENIASRTLARYYEESTYLVKAKIEMEPPPEFESGGREREDLAGEPPQQLPGLPFLPESMQPEPQAPSAGADGKADAGNGGIQAVTLDILVDTGYSEKDIEFIRNLLAMATRIDELRGDRVAVHEGVFPRDNRALTGYRKPVEPPPVPSAAAPASANSAKGDSGGSAAKEGSGGNAAANPFSSYTDHLPSLIPLLLICLLILACVWMVSRAILGASGNKRDANAAPPAPPPVPEPPRAATVLRQENVKGQSGEMGAFRPFLLNCFVGDPKHCGHIIKSWIQRDPDKGLRDSGAMIASLDARLMSVIAPEIGRDLSQKLEGYVAGGEELPAEDLLAICKEFKREFQNLENGHLNEDLHKDLFGFLQKMNEQQVMHILRDESLGIIGLVLAQLPGGMAGAILQKTDPDNRAKLLIGMGNIDNIPLNVYKEIADRLSLKALEVGNMRYVAADGVDSILELIDNLPLAMQFQYIHSISEMDLGLGEKLRNRYVTLPELVGLPDRFLANVVQGLDRETLILALLHVDDPIRNKVFSLLPERMRMMVSGGMESVGDRTPKDSEAAQRRILHRIRDEIKHTGRPA